MRTPTKILISGLSCSLVCLLLVGLRHRSTAQPPGGSVQEVAGPVGARAGGTRNWKAIEANLDDPQYVAWLEELRGTEVQEDELFKLMRSNLSFGQKNAAFAKFLRDRAQTGILTANPERWSRELRELVLAGYIDRDLAVRVGAILGNLATPAERNELEARYSLEKNKMTEGARDAIVLASNKGEFLKGVLGDAAEAVSVKEAAAKRLAAIGEREELKRVLRETPKAIGATVGTTAVGALAEHAADLTQLREADEFASTLPEQDESGRRPGYVVRVMTAESKVHGKALVLFEGWRDSVAKLGRPESTPELLVDTIVAGRALARGLWTEENPGDAAKVIEAQLRPAVLATMAGGAAKPGSTEFLQVIAELAVDLAQECVQRPVDACADRSDARSVFSRELGALVKPRIEGTEVAFLAAKL